MVPSDLEQNTPKDTEGMARGEKKPCEALGSHGVASGLASTWYCTRAQTRFLVHGKVGEDFLVALEARYCTQTNSW